MRKYIARKRKFEKSFVKLPRNIRELFLQKLEIFMEDEHHPSLQTHQLKGERKNEYSFSVAYDIRAIYEKETREEGEMIIFTFIDIGSHSRVY